MAKFELPPSEEQIKSQKEPTVERHERGNEMERHWPLINTEEARFIENTGGEYEGFVEVQDGQRFEDVRVSRIAYYDPQHRSVIEAFVSSEGANDDGSNELGAREDISEFTLMIVHRSRSGHELGAPDIIPLRIEDFPDRDMTTGDLRTVARDTHDFITKHISRLKGAELLRSAENFLKSRGWKPASDQNER